MMRSAIRRLLVVGIVVAFVSLLFAPVANADHGEGHNGETLELSKSEGLEDGEVVTVSLSSWLPGHTVTVVTCYVYPAAGPQDCELSNYGMHVVDVADDGTATLEYPIAMVPGRCDETTACLVVAADGFGADANYAAQEFIFASAPEPEPTEAAPEPEPESTEAAPEPESEPTEAPEPEPAPTEPEPEPTEAAPDPEPEPAPTEAPMADDDMAAPADDDDDGGSSVLVWLLPVIIVVVVLALLALWMRQRRSDRAEV